MSDADRLRLAGSVGRPSDEDTPAAGAESDPLADISRFRLSQDFAASLGVKKRLITVPVRKPDRQWFVRAHPSEEYRLQTAVLEIREDNESYLVVPELISSISTELIAKVLFTSINRQGVLFLWPIRLPDESGKIDAWNGSALAAAEQATRRWVRVACRPGCLHFLAWYSSGITILLALARPQLGLPAFRGRAC